MAPSTANWHWKNKTVTPWAKQWFERELTSVRVSGEGTEEVGVEHVEEVDGDVELGQRKSKCVWSFFACPLRRSLRVPSHFGSADLNIWGGMTQAARMRRKECTSCIVAQCTDAGVYAFVG